MQKLNTTRLKNGIWVYSMSNSRLNTSAIGFRSGSIHDPRGLSGMNHLVEHLTARRSVNYTERDVERKLNRLLGGSHGEDINIRCDQASVLYGHEDLRRRKDMWECFDLFANLVRDTMLDAQNGHSGGPRILTHEALKIEQAAIHNEFRVNGTDNVPNHICDLVHWHMYRLNPAKKRVDCCRSELKNATLSQVRQFIRDRYTTKNMFVILIGPKKSEAKEQAEKYFGDLPQTFPAPLDYDHSDDLPVLNGIQKFELVRPGIRQNHVALAFPTKGYLSKDAEALDVISAVLEYRIEGRLREENIVFDAGTYHPNVYFPCTFIHGMIQIWFATVGGDAYVEKAIEFAVEECEKLKRDDSTQFAEDCADRTQYLRDKYDQLFLWFPRPLSEAITSATCNGDMRLTRFLNYRKRLSRLNPQNIRDVAKKYLTTPDRFLKILVKPLIVPQEIIDRASDEARPYLEAVNNDPDFPTI